MSPSLPTPSRRALAALIGGLVLALTVFAASPSLHAWLHAAAADGNEATCVVGIFEGGLSLPPGADLASTAPVLERIEAAPGVEELLLAAPRYLRMPGRGPPPA